MNNQYVWIAIVIVGIVGGVEIGYAVSNVHYHKVHERFDGGWNHHAGFMMQDSEFRQHMYSSMFDSTKSREEMSQYLAEHPEAMKSWCNTMMDNPKAMKAMQDMMDHGMMDGMGMMGHNKTQGTSHGMGDMSGMNDMGNTDNMGKMMHH